MKARVATAVCSVRLAACPFFGYLLFSGTDANLFRVLVENVRDLFKLTTHS